MNALVERTVERCCLIGEMLGIKFFASDILSYANAPKIDPFVVKFCILHEWL